MKKVLFLALFTTTLWSCGGKNNSSESTSDKNADKQEEKSKQEEVANNADDSKPEVSPAQAIRMARKKKGDTLAIPYAEILKMMPDEIEGYKKEGDPEGTTINAAGGSYSMGMKKYKKGEKTLKITINDYNSADELFDTISMMWGGMSSESNGEKTQGFKDAKEPVAGMERYNSKSKEAQIMSGVGHRFMIDITMDEQESVDLVKKVFGTLPISELAKK